MSTAFPGSVDSPLLTAERLCVRFGSLLAVRNVTFSLSAGQLLGLIGPNGAGKTTLLRSLAGLQPATFGQATVMGSAIGPASPVLREVGFTPDTPAFYDELTVRQFLTFVALGYGIYGSEAGERIDFWLEKVWLTEKANQKIKGLSRGMRQRIGIARTLLPNPTVILLDEPAAGLDPAGRAQFRQLLVDLRNQGKALIVSSHILSDLSDYCTHVGIMSSGSMVQFGTVRQIADHANDGRRRYAIHLARPTTALREALHSHAEVALVELDGERATFEFTHDADAAAGLLAALVAQRIPIASFAPIAPGLEEAYLRTGIRQVD